MEDMDGLQNPMVKDTIARPEKSRGKDVPVVPPEIAAKFADFVWYLQSCPKDNKCKCPYYPTTYYECMKPLVTAFPTLGEYIQTSESCFSMILRNIYFVEDHESGEDYFGSDFSDWNKTRSNPRYGRTGQTYFLFDDLRVTSARRNLRIKKGNNGEDDKFSVAWLHKELHRLCPRMITHKGTNWNVLLQESALKAIQNENFVDRFYITQLIPVNCQKKFKRDYNGPNIALEYFPIRAREVRNGGYAIDEMRKEGEKYYRVKKVYRNFQRVNGDRYWTCFRFGSKDTHGYAHDWKENYWYEECAIDGILYNDDFSYQMWSRSFSVEDTSYQYMYADGRIRVAIFASRAYVHRI